MMLFRRFGLRWQAPLKFDAAALDASSGDYGRGWPSAIEARGHSQC